MWDERRMTEDVYRASLSHTGYDSVTEEGVDMGVDSMPLDLLELPPSDQRVTELEKAGLDEEILLWSGFGCRLNGSRVVRYGFWNGVNGVEGPKAERACGALLFFHSDSRF
jgi:hypothetical protein